MRDHPLSPLKSKFESGLSSSSSSSKASSGSHERQVAKRRHSGPDSKPEDTAARLGASSNAKLIGGQTVKAICFQSGGHERMYLKEAGDLRLAEEQLCGRGARRILEFAKGLALKAFIAAAVSRTPSGRSNLQPQL